METNTDIIDLHRLTADISLLCDHCESEIFVGEDFFHDSESDVVICEKCEAHYTSYEVPGEFV